MLGTQSPYYEPEPNFMTRLSSSLLIIPKSTQMYHFRYPTRKNSKVLTTIPNPRPKKGTGTLGYTRILGNQSPHYLKTIVGPRAKFHDTRLFVEGEILHVHLARRVINGRRLPFHFRGHSQTTLTTKGGRGYQEPC